MISGSVQGTKEVQKLLKKMGPAANKILRTEIRGITKEVMADIKPSIPRDTGKLQRSLTVRSVKSKKRYSVAFRVVAKAIPVGPKPKKTMLQRVLRRKASKRKTTYYAFAPEYGVADGPGKQPAQHFMEHGIDKAAGQLPASLQRIATALRTEWRKG